MSRFYSEIAKYYDLIFPVGDAQIKLIKELVGEPPADILDVACGSGGYSIRLRNDGYNPVAIDLDEAMIHELKRKEPAIDVQILNMLDIQRIGRQFDLIFCIGNSLVHLNGNDEIRKFLKACNNSLKPGGSLLIQIVNYDRILAKQIKALPTIKNDEANLVFERHYSYLADKHKIDFKTILKKDTHTLENHQMLHPAASAELKDMLEEAAFKDIRFFGSFKKDQYDPMESFSLVITAERS